MDEALSLLLECSIIFFRKCMQSIYVLWFGNQHSYTDIHIFQTNWRKLHSKLKMWLYFKLFKFFSDSPDEQIRPGKNLKPSLVFNVTDTSSFVCLRSYWVDGVERRGGSHCQLWPQSEQLPKTSNKSKGTCKAFYARLWPKHTVCAGAFSVAGRQRTCCRLFESAVLWIVQIDFQSNWVMRLFMTKWMLMVNVKSLDICGSTAGQTPVSVQDRVTCLKTPKLWLKWTLWLDRFISAVKWWLKNLLAFFTEIKERSILFCFVFLRF